MRTFLRILAVVVVSTVLSGCPLAPPESQTPPGPAPNAPAPDAPDAPLQGGVAEPAPAAPPQIREPSAPAPAHRPPSAIDRPVVRRPPPMEPRPAVRRPTLPEPRPAVHRPTPRPAPGALARRCRAPGAATTHYLRITTPRDRLPRSLRAGQVLLLTLARTYASCADCVLRGSGCPVRTSAGDRRLAGFEIQPQITVSRSGGSTTLQVSLLVLTHPKPAIQGNLSANATFDVELSGELLPYVLQSLVDSLKGDVAHLVSRVRARGR